jgi:hypothetical protein
LSIACVRLSGQKSLPLKVTVQLVRRDAFPVIPNVYPPPFATKLITSGSINPVLYVLNINTRF